MRTPDSRDLSSSPSGDVHPSDASGDVRRARMVEKLRKDLIAADAAKGKRGPARERRLSPHGSALLRLLQANESPGIKRDWRPDGYTTAAWGEVLAMRAGIDEQTQNAVAEVAMSSVVEPALHAALLPVVTPIGPDVPWGTLEFAFFEPIVGSTKRAATASAPPEVSVAWDKITITGRLSDRYLGTFLDGLVRGLSPAPHEGTRVLDAPGGFAIGIDGPAGLFNVVLFRSLRDYRTHRGERYWASSIVVYCPDLSNTAVAYLNVDAPYARCSKHRLRKNRYPLSCDRHVEDYDARHACRQCFGLNQCSDCASKQPGRANVALQVTGTGCRLGLAIPLAHALITPFVVRDSIRFGRCDIRVDLIDRPYGDLVLAQREARGGQRLIRKAREYDSREDRMQEPAYLGVGTGVTLGSSDLQCTQYDASGRTWGRLDHKDEPALEHLTQGKPVTRIELRANAKNRGYGDSPRHVVDGMIVDAGRFVVADLALVDRDSAMSLLLMPYSKYGPIIPMPNGEDALVPDAAAWAWFRRDPDDLAKPNGKNAATERTPYQAIYAAISKTRGWNKREMEWTRILYDWICNEVHAIADRTPVRLEKLVTQHRTSLVDVLVSAVTRVPPPKWIRGVQSARR